MFVRPCYRKKNGKRHAYWALVESYRTARGPRQRVVAYLGQMDKPKRLGIEQAAGTSRDHQRSLFDPAEPEWVDVDVNRLRVERCLDFGAPWVGLQVLRKLGLMELLGKVMPAGREEIPWPVVGMVLVLCRLCACRGAWAMSPVMCWRNWPGSSWSRWWFRPVAAGRSGVVA
jgi:hypothetical protein